MILYKKKQSYFEYFINKWSIDVTLFILKIFNNEYLYTN